MTERYSLMIAKTAEKELLKLQPKFYKQIASKIFSLQSNCQPHDCKALKGYENGYCVDQGEYRILDTIDEESKLIQVFRVGKRNDEEVYRNL